MVINRLTDRLARLERQSPNDEAGRPRSLAWLENRLREAEESDGPLPARTAEDDRRLRELLKWLAEGNEQLEATVNRLLRVIPA
jgi:hypothetical protein